MTRRSVLVVGGGAFGLAAALELRRRDWRVTVLDRTPPPNPEASSTDISKIVRMDYGSDPFFTRFAEAAMAGWDAWNARSGPPWYHEDGLLLLTATGMTEGSFERESWKQLTGRGIPLERLDPLTLATRFPEWNAERFSDGYFNPRAGWVASGRVVGRLADEAARRGVRFRGGVARRLLVDGARVRGVELTDGGRVKADTTVVAAGAWTPALVPGLEGRMEVVGQPVVHFGVDDAPRWHPPGFPVWAADIASTGWYGFPATADGRMKVGHHGRGTPVDPSPDRPLEVRVPEDHVARCRGFLSAAVPALAKAPVVETRICLYCDTCDGAFWIDRHPDLERLVVAGGGSGHGFKFAPVLGPIVAAAVEGEDNRWGRPFRWRDPDEGRRTEHARAGG